MRPPDLSGVARAWRIKTEAQEKARFKRGGIGYPSGQIGSVWIVNGPYHPFWSWWQVGVITLGDIPGAPPSNKMYPEAEYEFSIYSLNAGPQCDRETLDIDDIEKAKKRAFPGFLSPPDVQFHFHGVTDEQAAKLPDIAAETIVGGVSCDSDFRQWWLDSLAATVQHLREGRHG